MTNTEILMLDGCTRSEAEKHLKRGSIVLDGEDFKKNFINYMDEWGISESDMAEFEAMINKKEPVSDWGIVEKNGKTYYIMYIL